MLDASGAVEGVVACLARLDCVDAPAGRSGSAVACGRRELADLAVGTLAALCRVSRGRQATALSAGAAQPLLRIVASGDGASATAELLLCDLALHATVATRPALAAAGALPAVVRLLCTRRVAATHAERWPTAALAALAAWAAHDAPAVSLAMQLRMVDEDAAAGGRLCASGLDAVAGFLGAALREERAVSAPAVAALTSPLPPALLLDLVLQPLVTLLERCPGVASALGRMQDFCALLVAAVADAAAATPAAVPLAAPPVRRQDARTTKLLLDLVRVSFAGAGEVDEAGTADGAARSRRQRRAWLLRCSPVTAAIAQLAAAAREPASPRIILATLADTLAADFAATAAPGGDAPPAPPIPAHARGATA